MALHSQDQLNTTGADIWRSVAFMLNRNRSIGKMKLKKIYIERYQLLEDSIWGNMGLRNENKYFKMLSQGRFLGFTWNLQDLIYSLRCLKDLM